MCIIFGFLKDKLKNALSKFSKTVEEEAEEVEIEQPVKQKSEKPKAERPKAEKPKVEAKPKPRPVPKPEPKPEPESVEEELEAEPEKKEPETEEAPEAEEEVEKVEKPEEVEEALDPGLVGVRETLESYSDEDIDKLLSLAHISAKASDKDSKIRLLLRQPLEKIQQQLDDFERFEEKDLEPIATPKKSVVKEVEDLEELKESLPSTSDLEESAKEVEEEAVKVPEKPTEEEKEEKKEKKGFFSRLFGKKKEELEEKSAKELAKEEEEATDKSIAEVDEQIEKEDEELEEDEAAEEDIEREAEDVKEGKETPSPKRKPVKEEAEQESAAEPEKEEPEAEEEVEEAQAEEKSSGFFGKLKEKISGKKLSDAKFEEIFFDLEVVLMENNVAVEVIEKIKSDLKVELVDKTLNRFEIDNVVGKTLKKSIDTILSVPPIDILARVKAKRKQNLPFVIIFVGINGSGKTTTIAKIAKYFLNNDMKTVLVAADTFRAAAIQQLEEHADKLGVKMIKHDYGSDPAAVAFDGIKYAESKGVDVVLVDTAGRLHSNTNLMDEMKKIIRVAKPDMKIFIGESITGNDCIEQAQKFNEAIAIDGIVLSKADVDEKGGASLSVSYVTGKPILFFGVGQNYEDLQVFDKKKVMVNLGL